MRHQIHIFLTALMFFTRIPCPNWVDHSPDILNKSTRYFSLVGILVGAISAITYHIATLIFNTDIAIVISMVASIWTTGAFHEDGFADVCDGFGGGWTKEKILIIMKDSRVGTYGIVGLICLLGLKFLSLNTLPTSYLFLIIISGHSISRFIATTLIYTHPYVREDGTSKVKPSADKMSLKALIINAFFGIAPLFFFQNLKIFTVLIPLFIGKWWLGRLFTKWIGGQTGDCAGALQQTSETLYYLSLIALWNYIW